MLEQGKACGAVRARDASRETFDLRLHLRPGLVDEDALRGEDAYQVRGKPRAVGEAVGRVTEDQLVRARVRGEGLERVPAEHRRAGDVELRQVALDRAAGLAVGLDEDGARSPTREGLQPHRTRPGEEIEDGGAVDGPD